MAFVDSKNYPFFQEMLSSYIYPGDEDDTLEEIAHRVLNDDSRGFVLAVRNDIVAFLRQNDGDLDEAYRDELVCYGKPGSIGLTTREWLEKMLALL